LGWVGTKKGEGWELVKENKKQKQKSDLTKNKKKQQNKRG